MNQINNKKKNDIKSEKQNNVKKENSEKDTNKVNTKFKIKKTNYYNNKKGKTNVSKNVFSESKKADEDGLIFDNVYPIGGVEKKDTVQADNTNQNVSSSIESKKDKPLRKKNEKTYTKTLSSDYEEKAQKFSDQIPNVIVSIEGSDENITNVTGVRFKANGKIYYFDRSGVSVKDGDYVIVDTVRGCEFGEVVFANKEISESNLVLPLRPVIRLANHDDKLHHEENRKKEEEATSICLEKIQKHGLDMKLVDVQYTFDNSKLIFYFTSSGRVDFRDLVKDLASVFKTRIELRQIGIRDEAKILGGLGACGRSLCCATFLSDFAQVSIKMAKEQNLSLNSGKISGCCGRLMCCLQYEYKTYAEETLKTPPVDSIVKTSDGIGVVTEINPLAGTIKVRLNEQPDVSPKMYGRQDVVIISRPAHTDFNDSDTK